MQAAKSVSEIFCDDMKIIETPAGFSTKNPIADVETSNEIPRINGWMDYTKGIISVAGFFVDDTLTQFMIINPSKSDKFRGQISDFLSTINAKQLHAFNIDMEMGCFRTLLGKFVAFHEINPLKGKGSNKDYHFGYLIKSRVIPHDFVRFEDPLKGDGKLCPKYWSDGRFEDVRRHNVCCLVKEAIILQNKDLLKKEFGHLLDGYGWLRRDASLPPL